MLLLKDNFKKCSRIQLSWLGSTVKLASVLELSGHRIASVSEVGCSNLTFRCTLPQAVTFQWLPRQRSSGKLDCLGYGIACSAYLVDNGYTRVRLSMSFFAEFHALREGGEENVFVYFALLGSTLDTSLCDGSHREGRGVRTSKFGHKKSLLYLAALVRCPCCLRRTRISTPRQWIQLLRQYTVAFAISTDFYVKVDLGAPCIRQSLVRCLRLRST